MRSLVRMLGLSACLWIASAPGVHAQDKPASAQGAASANSSASPSKKGKASRARGKKAKRGKQAEEAAPKSDTPVVEAAVPVKEGKDGKAAPPPNADAAALSQDNVRKEGDTEVKTLEFSGLDIDGELKTPQLLYFLTRLRAEFGRPRLPHRSFMPELSRSTGERALR